MMGGSGGGGMTTSGGSGSGGCPCRALIRCSMSSDFTGDRELLPQAVVPISSDWMIPGDFRLTGVLPTSLRCFLGVFVFLRGRVSHNSSPLTSFKGLPIFPCLVASTTTGDRFCSRPISFTYRSNSFRFIGMNARESSMSDAESGTLLSSALTRTGLRNRTGCLSTSGDRGPRRACRSRSRSSSRFRPRPLFLF
uniref:(northern house mosquito) hypothetical protein n=1 Tax=Culex pipiens TaxID=7175 RepID=A0A8D8I1M3_CULPI